MALPFNAQLRTAAMTTWFEMTNRGPSANARFLPIPGGPRAWPFASVGTSLPFRPLGQWVVGTPRCLKSPLHPRDGHGLTTDGGRTVRTGRYEITLEDGEVKIYDTRANRWVQLNGNPDVGRNRSASRQDLTFALPDGSTVALRTGGQGATEASSIQDLAVLKGDEAVVIVGGGEGKAGLNANTTRNIAETVDDGWDQGATMRAGRPLGEHTFAAIGRELVGTDLKARRNQLGAGGHGDGDANHVSGWGGLGQTGGVLGGSDGTVWNRLGDVIGQLQGQLEGKVQSLEAKMAQQGDGASAMSDTEIQMAFLEIQQLQDAIRQVVTTMTNLQKADHESKMAIARNLA